MNRIDRAEASALVMASLCLALIAGDPALVEKVRAYAIDQQAPLPAGFISAPTLELADLAVMAMAQRALEGKGHAAEQVHQHVATVVIPIPHDDEAAEQSAGALALGSFALEYLRTRPKAADAFRAWLGRNRPDVEAGKYVTAGRLEAADHLLTMMAHVADQVAQRGKPAEGDIDMARLGPEHGLSSI